MAMVYLHMAVGVAHLGGLDVSVGVDICAGAPPALLDLHPRLHVRQPCSTPGMVICGITRLFRMDEVGNNNVTILL